jgi:hypothetical protein
MLNLVNEAHQRWCHDSLRTRLCADRNLYSIQALPLSDVRFIRRHTPTFGLEYIIIVLSSGETFFLLFVPLTLQLVGDSALFLYLGGQIISFQMLYCLHLPFLLLAS